jgi:hypothetical protein
VPTHVFSHHLKDIQHKKVEEFAFLPIFWKIQVGGSTNQQNCRQTATSWRSGICEPIDSIPKSATAQDVRVSSF